MLRASLFQRACNWAGLALVAALALYLNWATNAGTVAYIYKILCR